MKVYTLDQIPYNLHSSDLLFFYLPVAQIFISYMLYHFVDSDQIEINI